MECGDEVPFLADVVQGVTEDLAGPGGDVGKGLTVVWKSLVVSTPAT